MKKLLILLAFFCLKVDGQVLNIFPDEPVSAWHPGSVLNLFGNYSDTIFYSDTTSYCFTGDGNNYVIIRDNDILSMQNSSGNDTSFYISFWTYLSDVNTGYFAKNYEYNMFYLASSNVFHFRIYNENNPDVKIGKASSVLTSYFNTWINIIVTYNGNGLSTGIKIYVNNVDLTGGTNQAGTYVKMTNGTNNLNIGNNDETYKLTSSIYDFRIGKGVLSSADRLELFSHGIVGSEFIMLPCSEGVGKTLYNVVSTNIVLTGEIANDLNNISWENSQFSWYYNNTYGAMKINDYVYPNFSDKTYRVKKLKTIILCGQSNANEGTLAADVEGYETIYLIDQDKSYKYVTTGYFINTNYEISTSFGPIPVVGFKYDSLNTEVGLINYYSSSTMLYDSAGQISFNIYRNDKFNVMQTIINAALLKMFNLGCIPEIQAFVWSQGETDAAYQSSANAYENNLIEFVDSIRAYWFDFDIYICQLSINQSYTYKTIVRNAQNFVSENRDNIYILPSEDWEIGVLPHYSWRGLVNMGADIFTNIYGKAEDTNWYLDRLFPEGWTIRYCKPQ